MANSGADKVPSVFEKKIVKQIEYYFGDKNLPKDKFLQQKIEEDGGWVTLDCMLTFNRLKAIVDEAIGNALRKFGNGLMEVNEENTKLRRLTPLPEESEELNSLAKEKTIYCKGFPESASLDNIEEFFEDKGKCIFIKMRRRIDDNRTFKGSVFVEFSTKEEAETFLATKDLKYGDTELIYMSKDAYFRSKKEERVKRAAEKGKERNGAPGEQQSAKDDEYEKGCVIHLSGVGKQTSREDIKELFKLEGLTVSWVEFSRGDNEGFVRFTKAGDGEKAIKAVKEANNDKVTLRGVEPALRVIEGDEEKEYWVKVREAKQKLKKRGAMKKPYQRGNQKRARQDKDDQQPRDENGTPEKEEKSEEPPMKQEKTEKSDDKSSVKRQIAGKTDEEPPVKQAKTEES